MDDSITVVASDNNGLICFVLLLSQSIFVFISFHCNALRLEPFNIVPQTHNSDKKNCSPTPTTCILSSSFYKSQASQCMLQGLALIFCVVWPRGGGGLHIWKGFRILVSLRVFWAKRHHIYPWRSRLGLHAKKYENIYIVCVLTWSLLGVKKSLSHAQISLL